jgi:integral membrane protein (TIGR01906 family)|uniref:lipoprotein intramolecular transacylase Lit n=1 Tax=Candidatus Limnocylindrus sp. TaxID=2802978 RepID=UPI00404B2F91
MRRAARRIGAAAFTLLALLALTLGLFLLPPVVHLLLDLANASESLNVAAPVAHSLSDALVRDLLVGGAFDVPLSGEPLLSASERSHLVDVGVLFRILMIAGAASMAVLTTLFIRKRRWFYQALHDGALLLGTGAALVGGAFALAFDATFTFAHELLFPAGNWTFNPATDRLVQLYPMSFWLLAAISFCVVLVGAAALGLSLARGRRR